MLKVRGERSSMVLWLVVIMIRVIDVIEVRGW
jgi:hypothetical protein